MMKDGTDTVSWVITSLVPNSAFIDGVTGRKRCWVKGNSSPIRPSVARKIRPGVAVERPNIDGRLERATLAVRDIGQPDCQPRHEDLEGNLEQLFGNLVQYEAHLNSCGSSFAGRFPTILI